MSQIISMHVLQPSRDALPCAVPAVHGGGAFLPPKMLLLPEDRALVDLPQPRSFNSLSRAGLMLNAVGLQSGPSVAPYVLRDSFRVGVYCAIENGPDDFESAAQMLNTASSEFARTYKSLRSPKQHFRQLANVPASQLAIFLGINGPLHVFNHSRFAVDQALDQAEFNLARGQVDAALICSAFSLENPLVNARTWRDAPADSILCEGAACMVLAANGKRTRWETMDRPNETRYFGIADALIGLAMSRTGESPIQQPDYLREEEPAPCTK